MVKLQASKVTAGKTKGYKEDDSESSSDEKPKHSKLKQSDSNDKPAKNFSKGKKFEASSSSEEVVKAKKSKKISSSDSDKPKKKKGKKSESSSDDQKKKSKKDLKAKKKHSSSSSESDKKKKKKDKKKNKHESSSDDKKKSKKDKKKLKKDKKKNKHDSSSDDKKKSKKDLKKKKILSSSEEEVEVKKKKKTISSSEEEVAKPQNKFPVNSKKMAVDSSSDTENKRQPKPSKRPPSPGSEDFFKKAPPNKPAPVEPPKTKPVTKAKKSSSSSSSDDLDVSDVDEIEVPLQSKKKIIKTPELPQKRKPAPTTKIEPAVEIKQKVSETQSFTTNQEVELFIGGLAYEATEEDITNLFSKYGEIESVSLPYKNGSPSGIAFVAFKSSSSAQAALEKNNEEFMGRLLRVNFSSQKVSRKPVSASSGTSSTVFVGNLPYSVTEDSMRTFFGGCGEIKQVRIAKTPEGEVKGFGHVEFYESSGAVEATKLAGRQLDGRALKIDFAVEKPAGAGGFQRGPPRGAPQSSAPAQAFQGKKIKL